MTRSYETMLGLGATAWLGVVLLAGTENSVQAQGVPAAPNTEGATEYSVLEEGPVHEAFAEPLSVNVTQGLVVDQTPPEPIDEIPPDYRPEGDNVQWIPGYWIWLDDRDDFVWVSGVWRNVPPGREWTPGHWARVDGGYRWISGFWTDDETQQLTYLPYPPESLEEGPSVAAPGDRYFWVPGCWYWENNSYAWRPGYWYPGHTNWVWVPHRYVYTPRGALFTRGYWDYPVHSRGLLYAPVYWPRGYNYAYGYRYTPSQVVNTAFLLSALFINGDRGFYYYGTGYRGRNNFYPWYTPYRGGLYSPLYSYYSWQYGRDSDNWRNRFDRFEERPRGGRDRDFDRRRFNLVASIDDVRRSLEESVGAQERDRIARIRQLSESEREAARERARNLERFRESRARFEAERGREFWARLDDRGDRGNARPDERSDQRDRERRARVDVPRDFRPSTFDLRTADGADRLRRQMESRVERRVMRPNLDEVQGRDDARFEPRRESPQEAREPRGQGDRESRGVPRTEGRGDRPPMGPRNPRTEQQDNRRREAALPRGSSNARPNNAQRGGGDGEDRDNAAQQRSGRGDGASADRGSASRQGRGEGGGPPANRGDASRQNPERRGGPPTDRGSASRQGRGEGGGPPANRGDASRQNPGRTGGPPADRGNASRQGRGEGGGPPANRGDASRKNPGRGGGPPADRGSGKGSRGGDQGRGRG